MNKVLVIGHSPGATDIMKRKNGSPSLNRLNAWLDACGVDIYSFSNICAHHAPSLKKSDIDETYVKDITESYNKVIALGGFVSQYLQKMGVEHYPAPHPSPRNRKFNDKTFEPRVINGLQTYVNMV
jgi:hypothetical protein